ncbi:amidase family protein (plasmid) [Ochrobactrum quorumnocens]|uniref:Amidase family protein n=1 Tax=Ochrobactrum quorumnocens TaxID=271865 RepID=A0A248UP61_9HYPH|nr:amidase [[Ochrobactrum] quorumnocens]ASV88089.1 amidase family protein [[Ochrobactrum] quorumnocens]
MDDLATEDGMTISELISKGEISATEVLEASITRIERLNPQLNAVVHAHFDLARQQVKNTLPKSPLSGVPMLLKNTGFEADGMLLSSGSELLRNVVSKRDSTITARYKSAGMVILGKSNTPEFALSFTSEPEAFGATRNPWDLSRTAGGSSGGSTAAVASGMVPLANSSDGAGSTRLPASHCGLFGFKPSRLVNPVGPVAAEAIGGMSTPHAVTWSVRDNAAMLDISGGGDLGDPWASPTTSESYLSALDKTSPRLKVAMIVDAPDGSPIAPEMVESIRATAKLLQDLGHNVEEVADAGYDAEALKNAWRIVVGVNVALGVTGGDVTSANIAKLEPVNQEWVCEALAIPGTSYLWAINQLHSSSRAMAKFFSKYDVMLTPAAAEPAPLLGKLAGKGQSIDTFYDQFWSHSPFTAVFNASGCPAMSVPLGMCPSGLPIGSHIGAGFGKDALLFSLAAELERAAPWINRRPAIFG